MARTIVTLILLTISCSIFPGISIAQGSDSDSDREYAERIKRQLELANQLRDERLRKERETQQQVEKEAKIATYCHRVDDELKRLNEPRRRWYELDNNGERVYLTEAQVNARRESLEKQFANSCEG